MTRTRLRWHVKDVQADPTSRVNVRVVDRGGEAHFRRFEGVAGRHGQLELEAAFGIRRGVRPLDHC